MSDIDGGVFSRPPEGDTSAEVTPGASEPATPRKAVAKKAGTAKKAAAKKSAVKKAPVKKVTPAKKAAATRKAAPVKKATPVKKAAGAKKAPSARKRPAPRAAAAGAASPFEPDDPTIAGPGPGPVPGGPRLEGESQAPAPPPPPPSGGFGFGFEPPAAGTVQDPATTQTATVAATTPKPSRRDRRGAQRVADEHRAGTQKAKSPKRLPLLVAAMVLVLIAAAVAVALVIANQDEGTDYADLRVGDCVRDVSARPAGGSAPSATERRSVTEVEVVDCTESHETEVYAITTYPGARDAPFPGNEEVGRFVSEFCQGPAFETYVGKARNLSSLIDDDIQPSDVSWKAGRRQVICMAADPAGEPLSGSVKGSGR